MGLMISSQVSSPLNLLFSTSSFSIFFFYIFLVLGSKACWPNFSSSLKSIPSSSIFIRLLLKLLHHLPATFHHFVLFLLWHHTIKYHNHSITFIQPHISFENPSPPSYFLLSKGFSSSSPNNHKLSWAYELLKSGHYSVFVISLKLILPVLYNLAVLAYLRLNNLIC